MVQKKKTKKKRKNRLKKTVCENSEFWLNKN